MKETTEVNISNYASVSTHILPSTTVISEDGNTLIGGCNLIELAEEYGTPVFIYDEAHIEEKCREAVQAFPNGVAYASKAFSCKAAIKIALQAGMNIDVASEGEIDVAMRAGSDLSIESIAKRLIFHGNNKSERELAKAIEIGIGKIVIDSFDEIRRLDRITCAIKPNEKVKCMVRVNPGIEAHTHEYIMTGQDDSKFGLSIKHDIAKEAIGKIKACEYLDFYGVHAHIGSQIFLTNGFENLVEVLVPLALQSEARELCIGGGIGIPYVADERCMSILEWGKVVQEKARAVGLPDHVSITAEPGRSIIGNSAITLYTVGTIKEIPQIRTYVAVDGGFFDNVRPAMYGSKYEAFLPRHADAKRESVVTIVGKHCESGDLLVKNGCVSSSISAGDILAIPVTGAYGYSMASNYNRMPRPAVVMVKDGNSRIVIRRETMEDLQDLDLG